jgi:hypothetical protein
MQHDLAGKVDLVTGAGSGPGEAVCRSLPLFANAGPDLPFTPTQSRHRVVGSRLHPGAILQARRSVVPVPGDLF